MQQRIFVAACVFAALYFGASVLSGDGSAIAAGAVISALVVAVAWFFTRRGRRSG